MSVFKPNPRLADAPRYDARTDPDLNDLQKAHQRGEIDVYAPIPQPNGKALPSLSYQWQHDYKRRLT